MRLRKIGIGALLGSLLSFNTGCLEVGMFAADQAANAHSNQKQKEFYAQQEEETRRIDYENNRKVLQELRKLRREMRASKRESDDGTYNPNPKNFRTIMSYTSDSPWVDKDGNGKVSWGEGGFSQKFNRGEEIYIHGRGNYKSGDELIIRLFDSDGRVAYKAKRKFLETKATNFSEKIPTRSLRRGIYDLVMQIGDSCTTESEIEITNQRVASSR